MKGPRREAGKSSISASKSIKGIVFSRFFIVFRCSSLLFKAFFMCFWSPSCQEQSEDINGLASFVAVMVKQVQAVKMRVLPGDLQTAPWFQVLRMAPL